MQTDFCRMLVSGDHGREIIEKVANLRKDRWHSIVSSLAQPSERADAPPREATSCFVSCHRMIVYRMMFSDALNLVYPPVCP